MKKALLMVIALAILSLKSVYGQEIIRGVIKDESGQVLPGATVFIKNGASTSADASGQFSIPAAKEIPFTIVVSLVGYKPLDVEIYELSNETIEVILPIDNVLNEVVIIGYGEQKRADFTGSIASVSTTQLRETPIASFDKGLQGQVAGVQVTQTTGQPGGAVNIKIRGGNSITGGTEPLYVVDGFPIYNNNSDANAGALIGSQSVSLNALSFLNPGDIESISVLKDAAATAIYGSRGANGVVIITTKKGRSDEASVTYDAFYGVQDITRTLPLLNAQQWARLKNDALTTHVGVPSPNSHVFTEEEIAVLGKGTDWQSEAYRSAPTQNHQVTILGGNDKTHFGISAGYTDQQGIVLNTGFKRFSGRVNLESEISDRFKTGLSINGSSSETDVLPGDVTTALLFIPPTVSVFDEQGKYILKSPYESAVANPIATLTQTTNTSTLNRVLASLYGEYEIIRGLKAKVLVGADLLSNKQNSYIPSTLYEGLAAKGIATIGTKSGKSWLNENTLSYSTSLAGGHNISVLGGFTQQSYSSESVLAGSQSFINDVTGHNNLGSGSFYSKPGSDAYTWSLQSYLGRVSYNLDQKYYATATIRADGSSRFGSKNRWGTFVSGSLAWYLSKESFFKPVSFVSNLKLRLSAGTTGNQEIGQYQALATLGTGQAVIGDNILVGYAPNRVANPNLGWEKTYQYDAGIDLDLFKNRLNVVFDAYYKKTSNLLLDFPVPYSTGFEKALKNTGEVENKGIELGITTVNVTNKKLHWQSTLLFSLNRNKVLSIGGGRDSYFPAIQEGFQPVIVKVGQPLGTFYSYITDGIFRSTDDIANTPRIDQANTKPGDQRYKNLDGDDRITQAGDRRITGNAQPKFIFGFTNTVSYANFDLNVFFQGSYGNKIYSQLKQYLVLTTGFQNALLEVNDRWTPQNENGSVPRANENVPTIPVSDRFLQDGSYIRLKSVTLGYNFPESILSKSRIRNIRIYASALNLATWTNYDGYDPEVNYFTNSTAQGIDYSTYPNAKSFIGGLSITF